MVMITVSGNFAPLRNKKAPLGDIAYFDDDTIASLLV